MQVIGHRGAAGHEPENTLCSFQKALDLGVDMVELDVHASKDGHLMVIHDNTLDRTTNGHGLVTSYTKAELQQLDAGKGEKIPTLDDVYWLVADKAKINVEIKGYGIEGLIMYYLRKRNAFDQIMISSFNQEALQLIKEYEPEIKTAVLFEGIPYNLPELLRELQVIAYNPSKDFLQPEHISIAHREGCSVYVYTVDESLEIAYWLSYGVDGIISNFPDKVKAAVNREK